MSRGKHHREHRKALGKPRPQDTSLNAEIAKTVNVITQRHKIDSVTALGFLDDTQKVVNEIIQRNTKELTALMNQADRMGVFNDPRGKELLLTYCVDELITLGTIRKRSIRGKQRGGVNIDGFLKKQEEAIEYINPDKMENFKLLVRKAAAFPDSNIQLLDDMLIGSETTKPHSFTNLATGSDIQTLGESLRRIIIAQTQEKADALKQGIASIRVGDYEKAVEIAEVYGIAMDEEELVRYATIKLSQQLPKSISIAPDYISTYLPKEVLLDAAFLHGGHLPDNHPFMENRIAQITDAIEQAKKEPNFSKAKQKLAENHLILTPIDKGVIANNILNTALENTGANIDYLDVARMSRVSRMKRQLPPQYIAEAALNGGTLPQDHKAVQGLTTQLTTALEEGRVLALHGKYAEASKVADEAGIQLKDPYKPAAYMVEEAFKKLGVEHLNAAVKKDLVERLMPTLPQELYIESLFIHNGLGTEDRHVDNFIKHDLPKIAAESVMEQPLSPFGAMVNNAYNTIANSIIEYATKKTPLHSASKQPLSDTIKQHLPLQSVMNFAFYGEKALDQEMLGNAVRVVSASLQPGENGTLGLKRSAQLSLSTTLPETKRTRTTTLTGSSNDVTQSSSIHSPQPLARTRSKRSFSLKSMKSLTALKRSNSLDDKLQNALNPEKEPTLADYTKKEAYIGF